MFEKESKEKLPRAARAPRHVYQHYSAGQWVYVFRRTPQRARWSGPGLVLLHQATTIWVAMRARLWECNVDQVRPANSTEAMGVEIVNSQQYQELLKNMRAVDVAREGTPPEEAWEEPREEAPVLLPPRDTDAEAAEEEPATPSTAAGPPRAEESRPRRVSMHHGAQRGQPQPRQARGEKEGSRDGRAGHHSGGGRRSRGMQQGGWTPARCHLFRPESCWRRRSRSPVPWCKERLCPRPRPRADEAQHRRRTRPPGPRSRQWTATRGADARTTPRSSGTSSTRSRRSTPSSPGTPRRRRHWWRAATTSST